MSETSSSTQVLGRTECRRALEALRNGVPNRDAVRVLGCHQVEPERKFLAQLDALAGAAEGPPPAGVLVAGDFGTGKSHLLEHFQHIAIGRNFVCSRIVISKETPLYDLGKVFRAAVETAEVPGRRGPAVSEIALRLRPDSQAYVDFYRWAHHDASRLATIFPATLLLYERLKTDPELVEKVTNFWSGEKLGVAEVRAGLKQIGEQSSYPIKAVKVRDLALQRFTFVSRLIRAAGFAGWVLLIDEVELIGRYSILQRGRSYAELARWMGLVPEEGIPGCAAVATITDDFDLSVLHEKGDRDHVGPKLRSKGTPEYALIAARAEAGIRAIEHDAVVLEPPDEEGLRKTYKRLRWAHEQAYSWNPPHVWDTERSSAGRMRNYVRGWITRWDLARLYPGEHVSLEHEELHVDYREEKGLEEESGEDLGGAGAE
jgi:hypothetical protein